MSEIIPRLVIDEWQFYIAYIIADCDISYISLTPGFGKSFVMIITAWYVAKQKSPVDVKRNILIIVKNIELKFQFEAMIGSKMCNKYKNVFRISTAKGLI